MPELEKTLKKVTKVGTAKIAGFVCNKKAPVILRLDLEIPREKLESALDVLGLDGTDELIKSLEATVRGLKKGKRF